MAEHATSVLGAASAGFAGVLVASHDWYEGAAPLTEVLVPSVAETLPALMATECGAGDTFDDIETVEDLFAPDFLATASAGDWSSFDPWACYLEQGSLGHTTIPRDHDAPLLTIVSAEDDLVVADVKRADIPRLCEDGYTLDYLECGGASHVAGAVQTLPHQLAWVRDRLEGVPLPDDTCTVHPPVDCEALGERR